jgi:hypothetical protein
MTMRLNNMAEFEELKRRNVQKAVVPKITEREVTAAIRQILRTCGIWHFKHWGGPMGEKGVSDLIGCHQGRMVAIEVKKPGGKASGDQLAFLDNVGKAGGIGFVASSVEDVIKGLDLQDRFLDYGKKDW